MIRRLFRWAVILGVLITAAVAGLVFWAPAYWVVLDGSDPQIAAGAESLEQRMSTEMTKVRQGESNWTMDVTAEQINQWMANRMPQWLANQGVDEALIDQAHPMMVRFGDGVIEVAVQSGLWGMEPVTQLVYAAQVDPHRKHIILLLKSMKVGKIPVPVDSTVDFLLHRAGLPESKRQLIEKARQRLMRVDLRMPLGDGRIVEVLGMEMRPDGATLNLRTGWRLM
jgi:hypothetical protein